MRASSRAIATASLALAAALPIGAFAVPARPELQEAPPEILTRTERRRRERAEQKRQRRAAKRAQAQRAEPGPPPSP